ncbi:hypothetical protein [Leisingera sp. ANG-M7]|uniref:hypothetical protein n=1 Tax=Leisingera sp. ANG-M7 TaxID=1577902 RepID=UPI001269A049|nr:hypothetical protein [Leisingera sp. ANG-M7]
MADWPHTIPHDLKRMLETRSGFRDAPSDQDLWGVFKEWLERHQVEAPQGLPAAPEAATPSLGHTTPY